MMSAMQAISSGALKLTGDPMEDVARMEAWDRGETDRFTAENDALERSPVAVDQAVEMASPVSETRPVVVDESEELPADADGCDVNEELEDGTLEDGDGETEDPEEEIMKVEERILEAPPAAAEVVDQLALDAEAAEATVGAGPVVVDDVVMGSSAVVGTQKAKHSHLILAGICSNCAHCGMKLTDAVSIERGLGPVCSKRGYDDVEPVDPDEMQAFIQLAEYPTLCEHLAANWPAGDPTDEKYRKVRIRGLMNGLVRICSLNRKSPVHRECTKAIELLGYKQLAATLRESLAVVSITTHEVEADGVKTTEVSVWVKRTEWTPEYSRQLREIFGAHWVPNRGSRSGKRGKQMIPISRQKAGEDAKRVGTFIRTREGHKRVFWAPDEVGGQQVEWMSNKALIWHLLCEHFSGLIAKTDQGGVYIKPVAPKPQG